MIRLGESGLEVGSPQAPLVSRRNVDHHNDTLSWLEFVQRSLRLAEAAPVLCVRVATLLSEHASIGEFVSFNTRHDVVSPSVSNPNCIIGCGCRLLHRADNFAR